MARKTVSYVFGGVGLLGVILIALLYITPLVIVVLAITSL